MQVHQPKQEKRREVFLGLRDGWKEMLPEAKTHGIMYKLDQGKVWKRIHWQNRLSIQHQAQGMSFRS